MGQNSKKKYLVLFLILFLPSVLYLLLTTGRHNFAHLPVLTYTDEYGKEQFRTAPQFSFTNHHGQTITNASVKDKVYVVDFFFTRCPSICPIMTENMRKVHDRFNSYDDFAVLSLTVDPKNDTPEALAEYAVKRNIDHPNWHFLTGEKDSLYAAAFQFLSSAMEDDMAPGGFLHTEYFVLIDKDGRIRSRVDDDGNFVGVYAGTEMDQVNNLIDDIKVLMAEYRLEKKENNRFKKEKQ